MWRLNTSHRRSWLERLRNTTLQRHQITLFHRNRRTPLRRSICTSRALLLTNRRLSRLFTNRVRSTARPRIATQARINWEAAPVHVVNERNLASPIGVQSNSRSNKVSVQAAVHRNAGTLHRLPPLVSMDLANMRARREYRESLNTGFALAILSR